MFSNDPLPDPQAAADDDAAAAADAGAEPWDADDARRQNDQFAPPQTPCECHCLHCGREFMSDGIWFQKVINDPGGFDGFWKCPTPNCDGAGFTFDIFPTDPDHPANGGWVCDDEEDEEEFCDDDADASGEWDPDEPKYKALDEAFGDEGDDDIEGEEWKYGLQPGEQPPEPVWAEEARKRWEDEQKQYDEPDRRPRVLDWSNREDVRGPVRGQFNDDDIPF